MATELGHDWHYEVPVRIVDRYWEANFYVSGYSSPHQARDTVVVWIDELAVILGVDRSMFVVGPAERIG